MKTLLALKKKIAKKRSRYIRSDAYKIKSVPKKWRAARGGHSKIRKKRRGKVSHPGPGVASPRAVRGLTMKGARLVAVSTPKDLQKVNPKTDAIVISKIGKRNMVQILKLALSQKIAVHNIKKPEEVIKQTEEMMKKKKEAKSKKMDTKQKKKAEAAQKAEEKQKKEAPEEQKKPETAKGAKSEKIKTLEKRQ